MFTVPQLDRRVYCGPTAISACTGVHPARVVSIIKAARRSDDKVVGMSDYEVCSILGLMGWATKVLIVKPKPPYKRPTVREYASGQSVLLYPEIWSTTNHYLAVHDFDALCNQTKGQPVPIVIHPYALATLKSIIMLRRAL